MLDKRIIFLPYKVHQQYNLSYLAQKIPITVMLPPEKRLPEGSPIKAIKIEYLQFGANILKKVVKSELRPLKYVRGLNRLLNTIDIEALITCEFYHWYTLQCIAYKKNNPQIKLFVISETQMWPRNFIANIFKRLILLYFKMNRGHINGIFVYTQTAYNFIKKYIPKANIILLPTPIDVETFKPTVPRQFFKDGKLRILMNARFSPYKRHADLFDAVLKLIKDGKQISVTCISRYTHDRTEMLKLIAQKGLKDVVNVIDPLSKKGLTELNQLYDVLVLPSHNEAIGLVVPEAMACGTPTITSDTVGANVYVENGVTGLIFKTGDVDALADCIRACLNADLLQNYSDNAVERIQNKFTLTVYEELFKKAIHNV